MSQSESLVSACLIARNEAGTIGESLSALRPLAEELIVGDTGSTDRTVAIAKENGAKVIDIPWADDFAAARNAVLKVATGKWLLVVDCDEVLMAEGIAEALHHLAADDLPPALLVKILNRYPGGHVMEMVAPRLFSRAAGFRYIHAIHEQLNADGVDAARSTLVLDHRGYLPEGACEAKERRNLHIALKMPDSPHKHHCVARSAMALKDWPQAIDSCRRLVNTDCGPMLLLEGCAMGGGAALAAGDRPSFETFLALARTVSSDAPDIRLLELLAAGQEYIRSVEKHGLDTPGDYLRAPVFRHEPDAVRAWLGPKRHAPVAGPVCCRQKTENAVLSGRADTDVQEEQLCLG